MKAKTAINFRQCKNKKLNQVVMTMLQEVDKSNTPTKYSTKKQVTDNERTFHGYARKKKRIYQKF